MSELDVTEAVSEDSAIEAQTEDSGSDDGDGAADAVAEGE